MPIHKGRAVVFQVTSLAAVAGGAYIAVVCVIALIAAVHPKPDVRADARKVLDRLLKLIRPFGLRDLGDHTPTSGHLVGGDRPSQTISGPSTHHPGADGPHTPDTTSKDPSQTS
jgi:hypothetical protein